MPATEIRLYRDDDGSTPIVEWLAAIETRNRKTYEKCRSYLQRLADYGRELRRPTADFLRNGVYELRINHLGVNYRILYGFVGRDVVLVSHGITKERKVPAKEIDLAAERLAKYRSNPRTYCSTEEV
jgi:phage-related protein